MKSLFIFIVILFIASPIFPQELPKSEPDYVDIHHGALFDYHWVKNLKIEIIKTCIDWPVPFIIWKAYKARDEYSNIYIVNCPIRLMPDVKIGDWLIVNAKLIDKRRILIFKYEVLEK